MRKTTEPLHMVGGELPGDADIGKTDGGVYFARGPEFNEKFMSQYALPFRRETAQMVIASMIQSDIDTITMNPENMAAKAYEIADALVLAENATLAPVLQKYWDAYMNVPRNTDEVMKSFIDEGVDYSL